MAPGAARLPARPEGGPRPVCSPWSWRGGAGWGARRRARAQTRRRSAGALGTFPAPFRKDGLRSWSGRLGSCAAAPPSPTRTGAGSPRPLGSDGLSGTGTALEPVESRQNGVLFMLPSTESNITEFITHKLGSHVGSSWKFPKLCRGAGQGEAYLSLQSGKEGRPLWPPGVAASPS